MTIAELRRRLLDFPGNLEVWAEGCEECAANRVVDVMRIGNAITIAVSGGSIVDTLKNLQLPKKSEAEYLKEILDEQQEQREMLEIAKRMAAFV